MAEKDRSLVGKATKKKSLDSVTKIFFVETADHVKDYVVKEVIVPGIKGVIFDMLSRGMQMLLWGDTSVIPTSGTTKPSSIYHQAGAQQQQHNSSISAPIRNVKRRYMYDPLILSTQDDAKHLLEEMQKVINNSSSGFVSVADMYDIVGETRDWTDADSGWRTLRGADIQPIRGGWILKLPDPQPK